MSNTNKSLFVLCVLGVHVPVHTQCMTLSPGLAAWERKPTWKGLEEVQGRVRAALRLDTKYRLGFVPPSWYARTDVTTKVKNFLLN